MFGLSIPAEFQPWVALAILVAMFVLFILERTPVEVTAIGGAAAMLVLGILPVKEATGVLSNPAPWTIAMMFLVMGGLVRTGAVEAVIGVLTRHAGDRPRTTIAVLLGSIAVASAFMNNTLSRPPRWPMPVTSSATSIRRWATGGRCCSVRC